MAVGEVFSSLYDKLGGLSGVAQGIGALAGGIGQYKSAKAQQKMTNEMLAMNKSVLEEERQRRKQADANLDMAYRNSLLAQR